MKRPVDAIVALKRDYLATVLPLEKPHELLWVTMHFSGVTYAISGCYRPPQNNPDCVHHLYDSLEKICERFPQCIVIIGGDPNYRDIDWKTWPPSAQSNRQECSQLLLTFHLQFLTVVPSTGTCPDTRQPYVVFYFHKLTYQYEGRCTGGSQ